MRIAVAGGTGTIGRLVVQAARRANHEVLILSRHTGVNLLDFGAVKTVLRGVDAVIDVTSTSTMNTAGAVRFFGTVTSNLLRAGREDGVNNHVALSIIGSQRADSNYYAGKAAQERMLMSQPGGCTLLRSSQFHEFAAQMATRLGRGPLQLAPVMRTQPVAGIEVAAELIALAEGPPRGLVPDLAGPREESMPRMVKDYLRAIGTHRAVVPVPFPGPMGRAMRDGLLLPEAGAKLGTVSFEQWLRERRD